MAKHSLTHLARSALPLADMFQSDVREARPADFVSFLFTPLGA